mmetsp:Transcript_4324/g.4754  ORF Transcript_4324/g.4754 Transcript_4324/m.4754 type:complete len:177 (+) Transcript_4324:640-1170(+)
MFYVPYIGWAGYLLGNFSIERTNRTKAVNTLKKASKAMLKWDRSVAISPEGTRSKSGQLLSFKKGAFYLAEETKSPLVPILLFGAYDLWPPRHKLWKPGHVILRVLKPITVSEDDTPHTLLERSYKAMLTANTTLPKNHNLYHTPLYFRILSFLAIGLVYFLNFTMWYAIYTWVIG